MPTSKQLFMDLAQRAGFTLAGVAPAAPMEDYVFYQQWVDDGLAGPLGYLTDHRAALRADPRRLLQAARSVLMLAMSYHTPGPAKHSVARYAWGTADYHDLLRSRMECVLNGLRAEIGPFEARIVVDTAPLLERSLARLAGLGWIGRNTCLISQKMGSWLLLGAILVDLEQEPDTPVPDRCGSCRACIDACPAAALVQGPDGRFRLDARRCISTWTIEQRGAWPEANRAQSGPWVFGCDVCQEVCPWNRKAPFTDEAGFQPVNANPEGLFEMTPEEFSARFRRTPIARAKHAGLLRNGITALANTGGELVVLDKLVDAEDEGVREHARWALRRLKERT
jgi:epoxyqueuosine reductase